MLGAVVKLRGERDALLRAKDLAGIVFRCLLVGEFHQPKVVRWFNPFRDAVEIVGAIQKRLGFVAASGTG